MPYLSAVLQSEELEVGIIGDAHAVADLQASDTSQNSSDHPVRGNVSRF